jgi:uncharacterized protein with PQ loop repeat
MLIELVGYTGSVSLCVAGLPQTYKVIKEGNATGMHWFYLLLIFLGLILMDIYVLFTNRSIPLLASYNFQLVVFSILIWRKKFPSEPMLH